MTKAVAASSADEPLDLAHLTRQTLGDGDLQSEVLNLFVGQVPIYLERLKSAREPRARLEAAHTLKGAARGIGAWPLARAAEVAECADLVPEDPRLDEILARIEGEIDSVVRFIETLIPVE